MPRHPTPRHRRGTPARLPASRTKRPVHGRHRWRRPPSTTISGGVLGTAHPHNGGAATTPTAALSVPPPRPSTSPSPRWSCRRRRGTAAPDSFRSTHCPGGARHMAALASGGAHWRRPTCVALALCKRPAAALGPGDGDGPPWLPNGRGAGGVKRRTEGGRRPPTGAAAAPGRRGNSGACRRHPGAAAAPKRRQRCPTRDPTAAVQGAGASP